MKQYTSQEQTAKLIELGFEKPKSIISAMAYKEDFVSEPCLDCERAYSIGELIKMLPKHIFPDGVCYDLQIHTNQNMWVVKYSALFYGEFEYFYSKELIDALYAMIIKLKEEGVI